MAMYPALELASIAFNLLIIHTCRYVTIVLALYTCFVPQMEHITGFSSDARSLDPCYVIARICGLV